MPVFTLILLIYKFDRTLICITDNNYNYCQKLFISSDAVIKSLHVKFFLRVSTDAITSFEKINYTKSYQPLHKSLYKIVSD